MNGEALILRRYARNWQVPADRKVNPWDLNEPDPTDAGTMGTIPGATIACNVGDTVRVHFRNLDLRTMPAAPWERTKPLAILKRTHSLHAHGFTFPTKYDGAYPLSPPDRSQTIGTEEQAFWDAVGVKGAFKQGDRVPPGGTFTYIWEAPGPANAGVWMYHDHSVADMESTMRGALGFVVIRNPADKLNEVEITPDRLPGGSWIASPLASREIKLGDSHLGVLDATLGSLTVGTPGHPGGKAKPTLQVGDLYFHLNDDLTSLSALSLGTYRQPPDQALYLLFFHELEGAGMCINGRQFLGNAPTLVAGATTRMRFGVAAMGESFHTFHIHGHRWIVPGPSGKTQTAIEQSAQTEPTSPFEDTKIFGAGTSFAFTLEEGKGLFRANPPQGEWHLHCHVPSHMMHGMVGSLLVINGGELAFPLPEGQALPPDYEPPAPLPKAYVPVTHEVLITDDSPHFNPKTIIIFAGDEVRWINKGQQQHSATSDKNSWFAPAIDPGQKHEVAFPFAGDNWYHCSFHSADAPSFAFGRVWVDPAPNSTPAAPANPSPGSATPSPPTTHQVTIGSTGFSPSTLAIKVGDNVNWTNIDSSPHQVTDDSHSWLSPILPGGTAFAKSFPTAGTIPYHCHIHHEMTATLYVT